MNDSSEARGNRQSLWQRWFVRPAIANQTTPSFSNSVEPEYIRALQERLTTQERQIAALTEAVQTLVQTVSANNSPKLAPTSPGSTEAAGADPAYQPDSARLDQLLTILSETPVLTKEDLSTLQQSLAGLEKQVNRAGKEQLKTGTLLEVQQAQIGQALEKLQEAEALYQSELLALQEQHQAQLSATRQETLQALFPVLDSLDEALRSGQQLLAQIPPPQTRKGWFTPPLAPAETPLRQGMYSWLEGLALVRQRLLNVLMTAGIQPMNVLGQPFDPHYHVALEVVAASPAYPPGTVVAEIRRGYMLGEKVIRYAEVAVSRQ